MNNLLQQKNLLAIVVSIFVLYVVIWVLSFISQNLLLNNIFSDTYGILALVGGLLGIRESVRWGGFKSLIGKVLMLFSFGLISQFIGQFIYSLYYILLNIDVPYPSYGDVFYFGSVVFYILASVSLISASGSKFSRGSAVLKIISILIPLIILSVSYYIFLNGYEFDWANPVLIILDFGYPLGQAIYLSLGLLAFTLSKYILGGYMKNIVIFLIIALSVQYLADFTFLYQANNDTWEPGGINDLMYLIAYFLMSLALIQFGNIFDKLNKNG